MSKFHINQIVSIVSGKHKGRCGQVIAEVFIEGRGLMYSLRFNETRTQTVKAEYLVNAGATQCLKFVKRNAWCTTTEKPLTSIEEGRKHVPEETLQEKGAA